MSTPLAPIKEERLQKAEPEEKLQKAEDDKLQKAELEENIQKTENDKHQKAELEEKIQKQAELQRKTGPGSPAVNASIQSSIQKLLANNPLLMKPVATWNHVSALISVKCVSTVTPKPPA
jgi:flagellar biosynthesis GTPase FlhF